MKRKLPAVLTGLFLTSAAFSINAFAAVEDSAMSRKYDASMDLYKSFDSLDLIITETTMIPDMKSNSDKQISLQASGLKDTSKLCVAINITSEEGTKEVYYKDGYYYLNETGEKLKYPMKAEAMMDLMRYYIYPDFDSSVLETLESNGKSYTFTATADSLGEYQDKLIEGVQLDQNVSLLALQGYTQVNDKDQMTKRKLQTVYTVHTGDEPTTYTVNSVTEFKNPGAAVPVAFPDLTAYKDTSVKNTKVQITEEKKTLYAAADLNIRASNDISSAVLGGFEIADEIEQIGYTSNGWIQIRYNDSIAYVSADYVTELKPIVTKEMAGTMYTTTSVNVRETASIESKILGVLELGEAVSVSGYTNNNWIRVKYNDKTGYIFKDYLTWNQPVKSLGGTMFVTGEMANIRTYYSTDSAVLATLTLGDTVSVTGYTGNNWIRVRYKGQTGYIYGTLLSWSDPLDKSSVSISHNTPDPGTLTNVKQSYGVVINCGTNSITVTCTNGKTLVLDMTDASIHCPSGLYNGLYASIVYSTDSNKKLYLESIDEM